MKKVLIICEIGIATSSIVMEKVRTWLEENDYIDRVELSHGIAAEEIPHLDEYDIVISTTKVGDEHKDKVINGVPILSGRDVENVYSVLEAKLNEK